MKHLKPGKTRAAAVARRNVFIETYLANGGNASAAAVKAGYSPKTAPQQGFQLLNEPAVAKVIAERRAALIESTGITTQRVLQELSRIAFADIRKLYDANGNLKPIHELDDDTAAMLSGMDLEELFGETKDGRAQIGNVRKVKLWDKVSAIEKAMKHLGMFERDNKQTQPITIIATSHDEAL